MGSITIKDTGLYSVGASLVSGEKQAFGDDNSAGTELTLNGAQVSMNQAVMTNSDTPVLKKTNNTDTEAFDFGEADTNGIQMPTWTVRGVCLRNNSKDMITLGRLIYMARTKGYKELYSSTTADFSDIIAYSHYGEREAANESVKTVTKINVRITGLSVTQSADKKSFVYTLNLVETN